ncbi:hypothetical protein ALO83_200121 [Pseudomonas cannabina pv. alisalensis]|nr:hypothetical protein [Pseudomonas cannabina]KPW24994.1 hypothetical protein ALO83_200121 [Pseudomonas cannabina pv. alisalensis]RMN80959.1 hypothetical protein ALQ52_200052 [Pseudomonas cannabina pv. alisalensis]RMN85349.1 hypothetical protein ALQ53_200063 [Pseudomonas cannabina]
MRSTLSIPVTKTSVVNDYQQPAAVSAAPAPAPAPAPSSQLDKTSGTTSVANSMHDKALQSKLNALFPSLRRSNSAPAETTHKLAPDVRRFDTLLHPAENASNLNAGILMLAQNDKRQWDRVTCSPGLLLQNIEVRPEKGLLNLTGSEKFCSGELSQTEKRDLQRAVTSIVMTYNQMAAEHGEAPISIHENHLKGDGKVYEDRHIPRKSNEKDYDYYHTLGVSYADNGKMLPHYHLEFNGKLEKNNVGIILENLKDLGKKIIGKDILTEKEITAVLEKLPERNGTPGFNAAMVREHRPLLPNEITDSTERVRRRDELEGDFISLSSHNTELAADKSRLFIRNAHMNSFRPAEPIFECFSAGQVSVMEDLLKVEKHLHLDSSESSGQLNFNELLAIHFGLNKALKELNGDASSTVEQRQELAARFGAGIEKIKQLVTS